MTTKRVPRKAILIVNTASRKGADAFEPVRDALAAAGIELIDAQAVDDPEALPCEVRSAGSTTPFAA